MKLKALSNYDGDKSTRFGDCILIYDLTSMIVYDCGHGKHAEYVESFLQKNATITSVSIVVSHNDSDHTNGVCSLLEWLSDQGKYKVTVYTHQYLKHSSTILKKVDDAVDDERYLYVNNFSVGYDTYRIWGLSSCLHELSDGNQNTIHPARVPCNNVVCDKESRQESSQSHCSVSN